MIKREIQRTTAGRYRWYVKIDSNTIAQGPTGYRTEEGAKAAFELARRAMIRLDVTSQPTVTSDKRWWWPF